MSDQKGKGAHPAVWVPTLYLAEGLPFYAVNFMALIFYQRMGVSNAVTTLVVSLLAWPWTLKPLWSPLLEAAKTKKFFVVLTELVGGIGLVVLALSLPLPGYFRYSIAILTLMAFASSTHDIAGDGLYIASLTPKQQAEYAGWQGAFYNVARIFSMGGLVWLTGALVRAVETGYAVDPVGVWGWLQPIVGAFNAVARTLVSLAPGSPMVRAWLIVFAGLGCMLALLGLYHSRVLPKGGEERHSESLRQMATTFGDVVVTFFKKPSIWLLLVFIFLFRAGEGQVIKVGPLFLQEARAVTVVSVDAAANAITVTSEKGPMTVPVEGDAQASLQKVKPGQLVTPTWRDEGDEHKAMSQVVPVTAGKGGLGLSLKQFGTIYGTFGSLALIIGSIVGGYFTAWLGLRRALLPLICVMNLPMLAYWYLSAVLPTNPVLITTAMTVEMFGYGFGFVGLILLMMQEIAPGKYQMAHYAFANSLMNLGVILPGAASGWIQEKIGYQAFFIWVVIAAIPALVLSRIIPIRGGAQAQPAESVS